LGETESDTSGRHRFSTRVILLSVSCARGGYGPAVRAAGPIRSITAGHYIMVQRQDEAPLDASESICATSNGVNLRDLSVSVLRLRTHNLARGHRHVFGRADNGRIDAVAICRDPNVPTLYLRTPSV